MNQNFKTFSEYLGIGYYKNPIWFVGMEEGGENITIETLEAQLKLCKEHPHYLPIQEMIDSKTNVWNFMSKFLLEYYKKELSKYDWWDYKNIMFSKDHCKVLSTEVYPLSKPRFNHWSKDFYKIFGYSEKDAKNYRADVVEYRFPIIYAHWQKANPKITICYGKSIWNDFIELLKLKSSQKKEYTYKLRGKKNSLWYYPNERVILSPFFGNGQMSDELIIEIAQLSKTFQ